MLILLCYYFFYFEVNKTFMRILNLKYIKGHNNKKINFDF